MKLTGALRLLVTAVLLLLGTAIVWWFIGFTIGKGVVGEGAALRVFRGAYSFDERALVQLLALALLSPLVYVVTEEAQARWPVVAALALGAALVFSDRTGAGSAVALAVFVVGASAAAEADGKGQILAAAVGAVIAAFAATIEQHFETGEKIAVMVVRAAFFYLPLLLGPALLERWVLAKIGGGGGRSAAGR